MDDRPAPLPRISSRTIAMVAVAVLIVIAIAGIVLAGLRSRGGSPETAGPSDATQQDAPPLTAAASAAEAEDEAAPNLVVFASASHQLSGKASTKLVHLAETAKKEHRSVVIATRIEARSDRAEQRELAKERAVAVRQVLEANGVSLGTMRIEISELPTGLVPPRDANRVELTLR
jgi:outer membrane protein OmpA-like peptidoglycan-associated protein